MSSSMVINVEFIRKLNGIRYGDYFDSFASLHVVLEQRKALVMVMQKEVITEQHTELLKHFEDIIKKVLYLD